MSISKMISSSLSRRVDVFPQILLPELYRITPENRFTRKDGIYRTSVSTRSFLFPFSLTVPIPEAITIPLAVITSGNRCITSINSNRFQLQQACQFALVLTTYFSFAFLKTAEKTVGSLIGSRLKSIVGLRLKSIKDPIAFLSTNFSPTEVVNCYKTYTQSRFASLGSSASSAFLLAFRSLYL